MSPPRVHENSGLADVVPDLSIYLACGRVKASPTDQPGYTYIGRVFDDAAEAEALGFRCAFLAERHALKDAPSLLGGAAARTTRLEFSTGATSAIARHPMVLGGWGSTMQALNGPRLTIGLGRGDPRWYGQLGYPGLVDRARILRRLWAGETVTYDGPAGRYDSIHMDDLLEDVPPPKLWYFALAAGPKAAAAAADPVWDGVALAPSLTPEAVHGAVERIRAACERIGRDPATLRIAHCLLSAPELEDWETRAICHARLFTYLQWPGYGENLADANGWDRRVLSDLRNHEQMRGLGGDAVADQSFHRIELLEPAKLIPEAWVQESSAMGSVDSCVKTIQRFREAGAMETLLYGSTPAQNAELIDLWRKVSR